MSTRIVCRWGVLGLLLVTSVFGASVVLVSSASADALPPRGVVDPRIRVVSYRSDEVYRLVGTVGYHLDIEFESDEIFLGLAGGDLEGITFHGAGNVLTIKPKAADIATNLSVTTNRRRYYFDYRVNPLRSAREETMYAVRFTYPAIALSASATSPDVGLVLDAASPRAKNFAYSFCGHRSLKPVRVFDDGVQTRVRFPARAELPAMFVRQPDGAESLLNFSVDDDEMVIHRIAERLVLRRGKLEACIVNEGFAGSGERLPSGTVSPSVQRVRKGARS